MHDWLINHVKMYVHAVFLKRDGIINVNRHYPPETNEQRFLSRVLQEL
jgi:histidinol phosphatase-like enzyme